MTSQNGRMLPVCRRGSQPAAQAGLQLLGVRQPEVHSEPGLLRAQPTDCVSLAKLFAPPADQLVRPRALLLLLRPARQAAPGLLRGTLRSEIKNVKPRSLRVSVPPAEQSGAWSARGWLARTPRPTARSQTRAGSPSPRLLKDLLRAPPSGSQPR